MFIARKWDFALLLATMQSLLLLDLNLLRLFNGMSVVLLILTFTFNRRNLLRIYESFDFFYSKCFQVISRKLMIP